MKEMELKVFAREYRRRRRVGRAGGLCEYKSIKIAVYFLSRIIKTMALTNLTSVLVFEH